MYYTERLMLRAIDADADAMTVLRWRNDVDFSWSMIAEAPQPVGRVDAKTFCEMMLARDTGFPVFMICERPINTPDRLQGNDDLFLADGTPRYPAIGTLNFHAERKRANVSNQSVVLGVAFDKAHQGRGLGTEVLTWALDYAFTGLNLHRVKLRVGASNERARRCYRKLGFKEEGCFREEFWRDGKWEDEILMGLLRSEWPEKRR